MERGDISKSGDVLVSVNGKYVILDRIEHELLESPVKVYNFEVEDFRFSIQPF